MEEIITEIAEVIRQEPKELPEPILMKLSAFLDENESLHHPFFSGLSSKGILPFRFVECISFSMEKACVDYSLLASKVFLYLLFPRDSLLRENTSFRAFWCLVCSIKSAVTMEKFDKVFIQVIRKFNALLSLVKLKEYVDDFESDVRGSVISMAVGAASVCENPEVQYFCGRILLELLKDSHGIPFDNAKEILCSLKWLIMLEDNPPPKEWAMRFVIQMLASQSNQVKSAAIIFTKLLVRDAPKEDELRAVAKETILKLVKSMGFNDQVDIVVFVARRPHDVPLRVHLLVFDLLIAFVLELGDDFWLNGWGLMCLNSLIERPFVFVPGTKAMPGTRARATILATLLDNDRTRAVLKERLQLKEFVLLQLKEFVHFLSVVNEWTGRQNWDEMLAREAALLVISKWISISDAPLDEASLKALGRQCEHRCVLVCKVAVSALSEAFRKFPERGVVKEWLRSIPRLAVDHIDSSVREECGSLFLELVFDRISKDESDPLRRLILEELGHVDDVARYVKKICKKLKIDPDIRYFLTQLGKQH